MSLYQQYAEKYVKTARIFKNNDDTNSINVDNKSHFLGNNVTSIFFMSLTGSSNRFNHSNRT